MFWAPCSVVSACVGKLPALSMKMPAPAQTLPTVVPEDFDEGAIKDSDSDADPSVAALEPDLAEAWLGVSDPDLALPEGATAAASQDCRYVAGSLLLL